MTKNAWGLTMRQKPFYFVLLSILILLMMGTVYSYSVFRYYIEEEYAIGPLDSGIPYMISLLFYALWMMITGRFLKPHNAFKIALLGTFVIGIGWILASVSSSLLFLTLSYGVLIGSGVGLVYGVPILLAQHYFPQKSGLISGLILLGFGMSPLITAPLASRGIEIWGLQSTFLIFGIAFLLIQAPMTFIFRQSSSHQVPLNRTALPTLSKDNSFWKLYLLFSVATTIGLMMIGLSYQVGVRQYQFSQRDVTLSLSLFALLNGIARPIFGKITDRYGSSFAMTLSFGLMAFASIIGLINQGQQLFLYIVSFGLFWFNLGAWLAIIPTMVKQTYGLASYARIYGKLFTAYGLGAIIGNVVSGTILEFFQSTMGLYTFILFVVFVSIGFVFRIKKTFRKAD